MDIFTFSEICVIFKTCFAHFDKMRPQPPRKFQSRGRVHQDTNKRRSPVHQYTQSFYHIYQVSRSTHRYLQRREETQVRAICSYRSFDPYIYIYTVYIHKQYNVCHTDTKEESMHLCRGQQCSLSQLGCPIDNQERRRSCRIQLNLCSWNQVHRQQDLLHIHQHLSKYRNQKIHQTIKAIHTFWRHPKSIWCATFCSPTCHNGGLG